MQGNTIFLEGLIEETNGVFNNIWCYKTNKKALKYLKVKLQETPFY